MSHATWAISAVVGLVLACPVAGQPPCPNLNVFGTTQADIPWDDTRGNFINHETAPLRPFFIAGGWVVAVNQPAAHLSLMNLQSMLVQGPQNYQVDAMWKAGPGLVSVELRPASPEIWAVDAVSGAISVFDVTRQSLVRSIKVGANPHGIAFSANGDRAWVTCSGIDAVAVIDLRPGVPTAYQVVNLIPIPSRSPRGIVRIGNKVYVAPLQSGNNTGPLAVGGDLHDVEVARVTATNGAVNELPDGDVFVITAHPNDPTGDALSPTETIRGVGTILFDLQRRPGTTELWIPNTDALNADFKGAKNFPNGKVVSNRVTVVDVTTGSKTFIDLDAQTPIAESFSQPTGVAFDVPRDRVYVACYGGDRVAVLDGTGVVQGTIRIPARGPWASGPRAAVVNGIYLYVFNKNDNSISRINVSVPPTGTVQGPVPFSVGYDPTPDAVKKGRGHFASGENSGDRSSSCASCHVDGHTDGLIWNLGDFLEPEGTPSPQFGRDDKGAMRTTSMRGLRESLPYHWRGENTHLEAFNQGGFVNLLERPGGAMSTSDFADLKVYIESLVYPANPRQQFFRAHTPRELEGADVYINDSGDCNSCHALPLGTQNELAVTSFSGPARSFKGTQLRGVRDKVLQPTIFVGGNFGCLGLVNAMGAGLIHNGSIPDMFTFIAHIFPGLNDCKKHVISDFLDALDTGLAPSTATQATVNVHNAATFTDHLDLMAAADQGHCDLYIIGTLNLGGSILHYDGVYVPGTGMAELQIAGFGQFPVNNVIGLAAAGAGEWTFVGAPLGTGWRYGVDLDNDGLRDLDEAAAGTSMTNPDTDGDGLPDGHEVANGMSPVTGGHATTDSTPPIITSVATVYANTNTAKFTVVVDEASAVTATWFDPASSAGSNVPVGQVPGLGFDRTHSIILQDLPPGTLVNVVVQAVDPSGNTSVPVTHVVTTQGLVVPNASHVNGLTLQVQSVSTPNDTIAATAVIHSRAGVPLPNHTVHAAFFLEINGAYSLISAGALEVTDASGVASWTLPMPGVPGASSRKVHMSVFLVDGALSATSPAQLSYVEAEDLQNFITVTF